MRLFEECWLAHSDDLERYAIRLKPWSVGDADGLCYRTRDRGAVAWPLFSDKGDLRRERAWLARIMHNLHVDDSKTDAIVVISADEHCNGADSRNLWDRIPAPTFPGDDESNRQYVLKVTLANVMFLIHTDPAKYSLTEDEVDLFVRADIYDMAVDDQEAVAKCRAVVLDLFTRMLDEDSDYAMDRTRVAGDNCWDTQVNFLELYAKKTAVVEGEIKLTIKKVLRFRFYYAHHEPVLEACSAHFGCSIASVSTALKVVRPAFRRLWQRADQDVRTELRSRWDRLAKWKTQWVARREGLIPITEHVVRQGVVPLCLSPEAAENSVRHEYRNVKRERIQLRKERRAYKNRYGESAILRHTPQEVFTRRECFALMCDGVPVPQRVGRPAKN